MHIKHVQALFFVFFAGGFLLTPLASANAQTVEERVREYFKDTPVMIEIARCESKFRQFNADGTVLRGGWNNGMVGVFQFFESIHVGSALARGYDLSTLEGNLGYAKHLYASSGTTPWNSAKSCWSKSVLEIKSPTTASTDVISTQAKIKMLKKLVAELQELLEKKKKLTLR